MKTSFFNLIVIALTLSACSGNQNKDYNHPSGTHIHADGTIHQNHGESDTMNQEEFIVPADSNLQENNNHHHSHEGHEHPHQH